MRPEHEHSVRCIREAGMPRSEGENPASRAHAAEPAYGARQDAVMSLHADPRGAGLHVGEGVRSAERRCLVHT